MIIFGTTNKVFTKLQAIPLYNYPLFLNLYSNFIYIPLCFLYILLLPVVSRYKFCGGRDDDALQQQHRSTRLQSFFHHHKKPFVIMGLLDSMACILQTYASVYLPGSYLILLPQASAIPLSMAFSSYFRKKRRYKGVECAGAMIVIVGLCIVVLGPFLTQRGGISGVEENNNEYICAPLEGEEKDLDCSVCREETTREACLSHSHHLSGYEESEILQIVSDDSQDDNDVIGEEAVVCQWIAFTDDISSANNNNKEYATILIWSILMIVSMIPMTLSSIYKEISFSSSVMKDDESSLVMDPIYFNGWISVYQFCWSVVLTVPAAYYLSTPVIQPRFVLQHLRNGFKCYIGIGSISSPSSSSSSLSSSCHADELCHFYGPLFVNLYLCFNIAYNILRFYILKFFASSSSHVLFYLALSIMIPVGILVFALPFVPGGGGFSGDGIMVGDVLGLIVLMSGLVMYRFGDGFSLWKRRRVWGRLFGCCNGLREDCVEGVEDESVDLQESRHKNTRQEVDNEEKKRSVNHLVSSPHDDCLLMEHSHCDDTGDDDDDDEPWYHLPTSTDRIPPASSFSSLLQPR